MAEQEQDDTDALDAEHDGSYGEDGVRRPMNAFFIFCKRHRDVVREKYPHLENRSITKILGEWWATLDATEKSSYTALAKQYKEAFMKAHPDFKWYKLPTPPTRTLITRPSNNRCTQSKKDKSPPKLSTCGIALGKLADDEHLGGLSSLISPSTSDSSTASEIHDIPSSSVTPPSLSSNALLKPPKKRYLVNGEFKCQPEFPKSSSEPVKCTTTLESLRYDSRDHQTQNACSALLELAEICTNSANRSSSANSPSNTGGYKSIFDSLSTTASTNTLLCKSTFSSHSETSSATSSPLKQTFPKHEHLVTHTSPLTPNIFSISGGYSPHLQDQPLNLCKEKETTFTARNQTLIDHFVDKFLCDTPVLQSSSSSNSVLNSAISEFTSSKLPNLSRTSLTHHGFTLSAAIESAIDKAYSKDAPSLKPSKIESIPVLSRQIDPVQVQPNKTNQTPIQPNKMEPKDIPKEEEKEKEDKTEVVFIDKIKKACLASSRKLSEKTTSQRYTPPFPIDNELKTESINVKPETTNNQTSEHVSVSSADSTAELQSNNLSNFKREIKFNSSKYYSKFGSPPKKSRVWCNLFMKEQLKDGDVDPILDIATSPVRRNSQRTCKGRRYQALITEGLLQSTKERKGSVGKKPLPTNERIKTRNSSALVESPPVKPKKKKRDSSEKNKAAPKEDSSSDQDKKSIFDLNEKIASLPKCSIETLNKKKKVDYESTSNIKSSTSSSTKKASKTENASENKAAESALKSQQNDSNSSSGRFKSGGFDLEQHIASLPKCDIEVLNKRRSRKE